MLRLRALRLEGTDFQDLPSCVSGFGQPDIHAWRPITTEGRRRQLPVEYAGTADVAGARPTRKVLTVLALTRGPSG